MTGVVCGRYLYSITSHAKLAIQAPDGSRPVAECSAVGLGQDVVHYGSGDIGKAEITAAIPVGQFRVIDAEGVENGRMEVMNVNRILNSLEPKLVGVAVRRAAFYATAGQQC